MFIGHFGLSFAAKKAAPTVSLGMLFVATQFVDLLWPLLLVLHVEKIAVSPGYTKTNPFDFLYYPYTHSLFMGIIWGLVAGVLYFLFKRDKRGAVVVGLCVLSHWFLDLVVHTTDLPLSPFGDAKVGFGLWNHVAAAMILELVVYFGGLYIYASFTKAKNGIGRWGLWSLVVLLLLLYLVNTFSPPPSGSTMSIFVMSMVLMTVLVGSAYWVDNNRQVRLI